MRFPWQSSLDFKVTQILPGFRGDDEFVITLGIENLLNLIDDDKGRNSDMDITQEEYL